MPDESSCLPMTQMTSKEPSASKSLCLSTNIFDVKRNRPIKSGCGL